MTGLGLSLKMTYQDLLPKVFSRSGAWVVHSTSPHFQGSISWRVQTYARQTPSQVRSLSPSNDDSEQRRLFYTWPLTTFISEQYLLIWTTSPYYVWARTSSLCEPRRPFISEQRWFFISDQRYFWRSTTTSHILASTNCYIWATTTFYTWTSATFISEQ